MSPREELQAIWKERQEIQNDWREVILYPEKFPPRAFQQLHEKINRLEERIDTLMAQLGINN